MYSILFTERATREFRKLEKGVRERIAGALERVRIRPHSHLTKLVGDAAYKLRVGDWRVLMDVKDDRLLILVIKVGHRKNVYNL